MVGMSAGVGTSGVVCVNGRDVCWCGDFWSSVCEWKGCLLVRALLE